MLVVPVAFFDFDQDNMVRLRPCCRHYGCFFDALVPLYFVYFIVLGTNITFKRQVGINVDLDDKTPHGVFMKVGELGRGGWFVSLIFI